MLEKQICRRCASASLSLAGLNKSFSVQGSKPHYAPDRPFRLEHILLDVNVDPKKKTLSGEANQRLHVVAPDQTRIKLDQIGLEIHSATVDGKKAEFEKDDQSVTILLSKAPKPGSKLELAVKYSLENPRRGIYFTGPDADYPEKPYQVWTQGQDEDSRYWFPGFDYPNQKAISEIIATVPKGFTAVANGALLKQEEKGGATRFHYKLGTPHVTYLISLVVAEFVQLDAKGPRGLPVQYFVPKARQEDAKRAFGNTPKMIEAYEKMIGVEYPYEKYAQTAVQDFIFGGMENTSSTTQTDLTLHDARAHIDFSSDPLVSHELAHQWFGDLLTCRDWSHGWLNEGFATFMERVWIENNPGEGGGLDEAKYYSYADLREYMDEDAHRYRRPIVCNTYIEPIDLFDAHLYQKGGLVLNLLRHVLGEEPFWQCIREYVTRFREKNVETVDLIRTIEDVTGRNLRRFFDEWVFGTGYPEFSVSYSYIDERKSIELAIEQKQVFHVPVTIEVTLAGGGKVTHRVELGEARERIFIAVPSKPVLVRFDPGNPIPKALKFPRPRDLLLYQLEKDEDVMGRIEAAQELGKTGDPTVVPALGKAAAKDAFWGVQAEAADVLAAIRTEASRDALIEALKTKDAKARRAIARALGSFHDEKAAAVLKKHAEKDESYFVESQATLSWTASKFTAGVQPTEQTLAEVEKFLVSQLKKGSYRELIRGAALRSLAMLPGIARGEHETALETLFEWAQRGKPADARSAAVDALGKVVKFAMPPVAARIFQVLSQLADEENFRLRMMLLAALGDAESARAIPILAKIEMTDLDGRIKRSAMTLAAHLGTAGGMPESVSGLKASLEKLQEEQLRLRTALEDRQASSSTRPGGKKKAK